ncbi:putative sulfate exporter family transporter [bacterium]|nr:putative sulfate exporter family transporter [bacterium]
MFKKENLPGLLLLFSTAFLAQYLSALYDVHGKHPIEASAVAIVLGILGRNLLSLPKTLTQGLKSGDAALAAGIVFLGASLNLKQVIAQGPLILGIILITMLVSFFAIYFLSRKFSLSSNLSLLLAAGTTICGTSAIAVTAPLIKAKDSETSYAVGVVALCGLIAIFLYPFLGHFVAASDLQFGIFAGTAIHSTPQVVGAGYIYSDLAGQTATTVKLVRNCFMAPMAFLIAFLAAKSSSEAAGPKLTRAQVLRAFPWFLFGYFILAGINSLGYIPAKLSAQLSDLGKFLIIVGMAGVGFLSDLRSISSVGYNPLIVGCLGSLIVALVSSIAIACLV